MRKLNETVEIEYVWLVRVGGNVQVLVQLPGEELLRLAITEPVDACFSHCIEVGGIKNAPAVEWLREFRQKKEAK